MILGANAVRGCVSTRDVLASSFHGARTRPESDWNGVL